ncbi:BTAD domain-containing putative transcriptional regulator [Yoonia vestfoldensis]|uniref:BTAD domain-containing putative transcriptional regulator n=1 Tax=Yoonia vestfoldensis TaxID=245188 RepID=UPI0003A24623|nr:BTAD domain-containing putative transcriptional regulator [Yoonia vestfoldensis]
MPTRKSWALLGFVAQNATKVVSREEVAALLWPNSGEEQSRASLRQELSVIRRALAPLGVDPVHATKESLQFNDHEIAVDSLAFLSAARTDPRLATQAYTGPLLAGLRTPSAPFEDWLNMERIRLQDTALTCANKVLEEQIAQDDAPSIIAAANAVLAIDPTVEEAHRALMSGLFRSGRRAEALRQFERCTTALSRDLDLAPSAETRKLAEYIRNATKSGAKVPPPAVLPARATQQKRHVTVTVIGARPIGTDNDDIEGFAGRMDSLHAALDAILTRHGGRIVQRVNDRIFAVFGYPKASEYDLDRAIRACLDARATIMASGDTPAAMHAEQDIRCGIAQGEVLIGADTAAPSPSHKVTGPPMGRALELQAAANAGDILIATEAAALAATGFVLEDVPAGAGLPARRVLRARNFQNRFDTSLADKTLSEFVSRESELTALCDAWYRTKGGATTVALISGDPGVGKSRLLYETLNRIGGHTSNTTRINGSPHHMETAWGPFLACLRQVLRLDDHDNPETRRDAVARWWATTADPAPEQDHLGHILGDLLVPARAYRHKASPEPDQRTIHDAIVEALMRQASTRPKLFILEDLHWFDPSSQDTWRHLLARLTDTSAFVLMSHRDGAALNDRAIPGLMRIELAPLSKHHAMRLAKSIEQATLPAKVIEDTVRRSSGIPLYVEELVQSTYGRNAVPDSLHASLMARIDRHPECRDILQKASAIGMTFGFALLKQTLDIDDAELEQKLRQLQASQLIFRVGLPPYAHYEFKHVLLQEMVYDTMLRADRQRCHLQIAHQLDRPHHHDLTVSPEIIARHFELGGETDKALEFFERAGRHAASISAHSEAAEHFRKAMSLAAGADPAVRQRLLLQLGAQLLATNGFAADEVSRVYDGVQELGNTDALKVDVLQLLWGRWSHCIVRAEVSKADAIADQFDLHAQREKAGVASAASHYIAGVSSYYKGAIRNAIDSLRAAQQQTNAFDAQDQVRRFGLDLSVASHAYLCWALTLAGRHSDADDAAQIAVQSSEECRHEFTKAFAMVFVARMHALKRDFEATRQHALAALHLSEGQGFAQWQAQAQMLLGRALDQLGDGNGLPLIQRGLSGYLATGAQLARPIGLSWLADCAQAGGDFSQAQDLIERATTFCHERQVHYYLPELARMKIKISASADGISDHIVETELSRIITLTREKGNLIVAHRAARDLAALYTRQGRPEAAKNLLISI